MQGRKLVWKFHERVKYTYNLLTKKMCSTLNPHRWHKKATKHTTTLRLYEREEQETQRSEKKGKNTRRT